MMRDVRKEGRHTRECVHGHTCTYAPTATYTHTCKHSHARMQTYTHIRPRARDTVCRARQPKNKHIRAEKIHARHATNTKCTSITTLAWGRSGSYIRRWIRTCKLMSGHETLRGCGEPMGDLVVVGQNERAKGHVFCGKKN